MIIKQASFVKSATTHQDCPEPVYPEYAFIGRSNVGKSSLINMLVGQKKLAKTSSTPGKTRLINHFLINDSWFLCDLPGAGFAKVAKTTREKWEKMIRDYLLKRSNLMLSFMLVDVRHEPLKNDLIFLEWLGSHNVPFHIVFTKSDKLGLTRLRASVAAYEKHLGRDWDPLPRHILSSSETGQGRDEILQVIGECNRNFVKP